MNHKGPDSSAPVNRILRSSIVDGPGNRAVVFVQGCNFNCVYCHNPETIALCSACGICVSRCPAGALSAYNDKIIWEQKKCVLCDECIKICPHSSSPRVRVMNAHDVIAEIAPSLPFIRGITVSGGECTLYPNFLQELGKLAKENKKTFFLDTNGNYDFSANPELLSLCDGIMLDIKASPADGEKVTGQRDYNMFGTAEFLAGAGKLYEIRTVVSPGLFDAAALVDETCRRIAPINKSVQYKLIRYRPNGVRPSAASVLAAPEDLLMEKLAAICGGYGIKAVVV
ncbi:radical SAM domain protein [Spirochaetia bacterium]|nr:radical SAM domain protein [Spirochaetia bacterium]